MEIDVLNKKIQNFQKNAGNLNEKNKFKASTYMADLTEKDGQLKKARMEVLKYEEEMKKLSVMKTKLITEREAICNDMKLMEGQIAESQATLDGQKRLIFNLTSHAKNKAAPSLATT